MYEERPSMFQPNDMPWWGDSAAAESWANAVGPAVRLSAEGWGACFAYGRDGMGGVRGQQWFDYLEPPRASYSSTDEEYEDHFAVAEEVDAPLRYPGRVEVPGSCPEDLEKRPTAAPIAAAGGRPAS